MEGSSVTVRSLIDNGITLEHALEAYFEAVGDGSVDKGCTTGNFNFAYVKVITEEKKVSYVNWLAMTKPNYAANKARHHVVQSWDAKFETMLIAIGQRANEVNHGPQPQCKEDFLDIAWHKAKSPRNLTETFFVCVFVVNQHMLEHWTWGTDNCQIDKFPDVARSIHNNTKHPMVVVVESTGAVFRRTQCLWELHAAFTSAPPIDVELCGKGLLSYDLNTIDSQSAGAYSQHIDDQIKQQIRSMPGGHMEFDALLKSKLSEYLEKNLARARGRVSRRSVPQQSMLPSCPTRSTVFSVLAMLFACVVSCWGVMPWPFPWTSSTLVVRNATPVNNYLWIGNPGVGKSTLANANAGAVLFKSGVSYGSGLTIALHKVHHGGSLHMDTPGLRDITMQKRAASEISEALKQEGTYKVLFVITLESGRIRPDDVVVMELVLQAAPTIRSYGVVINKLPKRTARMLRTNATDFGNLKTYLMAGLPSPTDHVLLLDNIPELEDEQDQLWAASVEFRDFMENTPGTTIGANNVRDIDVKSYSAMVATQRDLQTKLQHNAHEFANYKASIEKQLKQQEALALQYKQELAAAENRSSKMQSQLDNYTFDAQRKAELLEKLQAEMNTTREDRTKLEEKTKAYLKEVQSTKDELAKLRTNASQSQEENNRRIIELESAYQLAEQRLNETQQAEKTSAAILMKLHEISSLPSVELGLAELALISKLKRGQDQKELMSLLKLPQTLFHDGYEYRTMMQGVPVDASANLCHEGWIPQPQSYELAPDIEEVRNIVKSHTWSTHSLVLGSLKAYVASRSVGQRAFDTTLRKEVHVPVAPGSEFGDKQPKAVKSIYNDVTGYECPWTCYQILIRKKI
eukprot:TRINITY_DN20402_c0_g1_i1.p1 TRINITY_DN20402_c0_g1~~TRINITY_DN20402_c0_g1_i1.p1  ORF type:complete len:889 (+),score=89.70 TRINITY_DN20402_c0_g1_i1:96-2669(+)